MMIPPSREQAATSITYPPHIAALKPYVPGLPISAVAARSGVDERHIAKLASNENPLGASPRALAALAEASIDLSRYPDSDCAGLCRAIAQFHDLPPDWVVVGAGSESVLGNLVGTMLSPGRSTLYPQYSFQAYVNAVQKVGAQAIVLPSPDFKVDLQALAAMLETSTASSVHGAMSMVYIANPGNPTGTAVDPQALEAFIERVPPQVVVLLDEAYFEYLPASLRGDSMRWVREHANLVVTRTFSKAYGLAGLRVGYGIAQPALADVMRRVRSPFTISEPAQVAATAALQDTDFIERTRALTDEGRARLAAGLAARGYRCIESHTNFVLVDVGGGAAFAARLETQGLIVRPVGSYGLADWVRISIGSAAEVDRVLAAI